MLDGYRRAAELIGGADALLVCAGAGMGVDSGLPDFRGDQGFWRAYPPYARLGLRFTELADPAHFSDDPELAWGFYGHRLRLYRETKPHDGFALLREWGEGLRHGVRVFTSNVDGQFQRAGFEHVTEVHGSIHHLQCLAGCSDDVWPADGVDVRVREESMRAERPLPECSGCGGLARPNILMFGDYGWVPDRSQAQLDELSRWRRECDSLVVVELGAGLAIPTVRRHAEFAASGGGALIRINPYDPEIRGRRGVSLAVGALEGLHGIAAALRVQ